MPKRQGNNPKRRIVPAGKVDRTVLRRLENEARYVGSAHHKRAPADYGFDPPVNPRPDKSLCDAGRIVRRDEAKALFREGVRRGMTSSSQAGEFPKYIWAVDSEGRAYEAKIEQGRRSYHGYELGDDDAAMRQLVIEEWRVRCPLH